MALLVTLTGNRFGLAAPGFKYSTDHETVTVQANVLIGSDTDYGVYSDFANSVLLNKGIIAPADDHGVEFDSNSNNSAIVNFATGVIVGTAGVHMHGAGSETLTNFGKIVSTGTDATGALFGENGENVQFINHGIVTSGARGVRLDSEHTGGLVNNFGLIEGSGQGGLQDAGILVDTLNNLTSHIVNNATGIIKATDHLFAIRSIEGKFVLNNFGKVIGNIVDEAGVNDVVINHGKIIGQTKLGDGSDTFNGNGGISGAVFGEVGNDHLAGGATADRLHGGDNNDVLTGRLGADRFFFDTALNPVTNVDTITDFSPAQHDKIVLSEKYFTDLGAVGVLGPGHFHVGPAVNANPQIDYNPGNGFLSYDQDGNGSMFAAIHFATLGLATHPVIHNTDFILIA